MEIRKHGRDLVTVVERYFDNGKIEIFIDFTKAEERTRETAQFDEYRIIMGQDQVEEYLKEFDEPFSRIKDIREAI
jgi:hypothetical protein